MSTNTDLALPKGSLILVTGSSGYIAGHIVNETIKLGYKVRGTVRSTDKGESTKKTFNSPDYSYAIVEDMSKPGAFDEAVKGVDGIIHAASVTQMEADPNFSIPPTIAGVTTLLDSALKESSIKRFVYTSSSTAAALPKPGVKFHVDASTWDDEAVQGAWAPPPYTEERSFVNYAASKTEAERALWKFKEDKTPGFVINAVLPNANFGTVLSSPGATGGMIISAYKGDIPPLPPQWVVDVVDDARIHVAAAIDKSVSNERIFAYAEPFNWADILEIIHKQRPNAKLPSPPADEGRDISTVDNKLGAQLLKKWFGQDGWTSLEETVRRNLEGVE